MKPSLTALTASLFLAGCSSGSFPTERHIQYRTEIINGTAAEHSQFPSIVVLTSISSGGEYCSGTLIKLDLVMTAGHCLDDFEMMVDPLSVVYGTSDIANNDGIELKIAAWGRYQNYNQITEPWNDIGLTLLEKEIPDAITAPILPPEQYDTFLLPGSIVTIAGYGQDSEMQHGGLHYGEVPVISRTEFEIRLGEDDLAAPNACFGDSGGPAYMVDNGTMYVTGVASRLPPEAMQCGESAIYTLPGSYISWIEETYPELQQEARERADPVTSSASSSSSSSSSGSGGSGGSEEYYPPVAEESPADEGCGCVIPASPKNNSTSLFALVGLLYLARRRKE